MLAGDLCAANPENIDISPNLLKLFQSCDVKAINFEAPLSGAKIQSPNGATLLQSNFSPQWVENNGFDIISLANNHMLDYGKDGLLNTKNAFKNSITVGAGNWNDAYEVKFVEIKGVKIGFFSGTSSDFSSLKDEWTDSRNIGCAYINHRSVNKIIATAKERCDFLIVLSHGGIEFMDVPLPEWRDRYRDLIDAGADVIIGSHPHVPQGVEQYKGKSIFYSLGNLFFDNNDKNRSKYWDKGLIAVLEIENGKIDCYAVTTLKNGNSLDIDDSLEAKEYLEYLNAILQDNTKYLERVNSEVLKFFEIYKSWLLSGVNAVEIKLTINSLKMLIKAILKPRFNNKITLHQIREDSTRWLLARALKIKSKTEL